MNRPPPVPYAMAAPGKKILLVAPTGPRRNLRSNVLRRHGLEVTCATHISDARLLWHPAVYNLVLLDTNHDVAGALEFCKEMRETEPCQLIAFLVGKPEYLASSPGAEQLPTGLSPISRYEENLRDLMANACETLPRRGGFLEATWRISLKRSALSAERPNPPRQLAAPTVTDSAASESFGEAVRRAELACEVSS
jgi:CheY-like chemotaxis protein